MTKRLLLLENDVKIEKVRHRFVFNFAKEFIEKYTNGEVVHMSNLRTIDSKKIFEEFNNCTDIAFQSSLVNGSEYQVEGYLRMLMRIETPINLTLRYLGGDIKEWIVKLFEPKDLVKLSQHNFFELKRMYSEDDIDNPSFDFSEETKEYLEQKRIEKEYRNSAEERPTGRKIKVFGCSANGKQFENLPIGEIVDELDMSMLDPNVGRGVWIMGNGEPIKLINDSGFREFEIVLKKDITPDELLENIFSSFSIDRYQLNNLEYEGLKNLISNDENSMTIANFICEYTNTPKRGNRQKIYLELEKNNNNER